MVETMTAKYCECGGMAGYLIVDGQLVCQSCGGLSPTSKLVGDHFVKIGESRVTCPQCGYVIQEAKVVESAIEATGVKNKRR